MRLLATIFDLLRYSLPTPGGAGVAVSLIAAGLLAARRQDLRSHPPGSPHWLEMLLFFAGPLVSSCLEPWNTGQSRVFVRIGRRGGRWC
ncbi:MAG TPA: hypothetical protein VFE05_09130 [Longimicrobiaceae bacterium]|jgi:hypothetical protein|nr:hypothetical protein [Longimicrobiaceae bacterium]